MPYARPITEIIERRFSCRSYLDTPIEPTTRQQLDDFLSACRVGPLRTPARLKLIAATEQDLQALKGLGTYGQIRGATGFLIGAVNRGDKDLEDLGFLMEQAVLFATDLGLGTCWLGGIFTRSSFAKRMGLRDDELMPVVVSVGYVADRRGLVDRLIRLGAGSHTRLPWEHLFFDHRFGAALSPEAAGRHAVALEMVRLGPSASNKQPWRIIKDGEWWHFYLRRTPGYPPGNRQLLRIADLQRVDLGIAMCHFGLTAEEAGLRGRWDIREPAIEIVDRWTEYVASWIPA